MNLHFIKELFTYQNECKLWLRIVFVIVAFGEKKLGLNSSQGRRALNEKLYAGRKVAGIQKSVTWGKMHYLPYFAIYF